MFEYLIYDGLYYSRFQRIVLRLRTEIRNAVQQVGQRYKPLESEFHLSKATEFDQFQALENSIADMETKKLLVCISSTIILLFIVLFIELSPSASSSQGGTPSLNLHISLQLITLFLEFPVHIYGILICSCFT